LQDSPWSYDVSGSTPSLHAPKPKGTVSIDEALASLPVTPDLTLDMEHSLYHPHPQTSGGHLIWDSYSNRPFSQKALSILGVTRG
jgi:hypothetical protein